MYFVRRLGVVFKAWLRGRKYLRSEVKLGKRSVDDRRLRGFDCSEFGNYMLLLLLK